MNKWINILILFCLTGCATSPEKSPEGENELVQEELLDQNLQRNPVIDEEVLYLLMAAELAGQRNQYAVAFDAYLQAAKRVDDPRIAERAVKIGLYLKDEKRTQEALKVWLSKDAKNLSARKFALLLAIKNLDHKGAVEDLSVMLREDPAGFEASLLEMVKLFEKEGRLQFTYDALEELAQQQPLQGEVFFVQAVLAGTLPNQELAQQKIDYVLKLQPDWNKAIIFQAQLAGRNGDLVKARQYLEKAVKQAPGDVQLRKMLIEVMISTGAYDDAVRLCQNVLDEKPDDGDSLFSLAMIYIQQNQLDKAENQLEKLLNNPDWEGQASFFLGKIEAQRRHVEKALSWYDRVSDGNYAYDADIAAISLLINQKRFAEAERRVGKAEHRFPEQKLKTLMIKSELLNQQGKFQEAFDTLNVVIKDVPDNRDVLYARALIAERLDRLDILEADLHRILHKNPEDIAALNALGYTLTDKTQRYAEAQGYLEQALKLQPDEAVIIDSYGWLQFKLGNQQLALEYLKKAYAKSPENEIAAHVAEVLWVMGNTKEAKDVFDSAYKKSPDDEYLQSFKKRYLTAEPK
ncbi:tetratricopeptide repeat protein [Methylomonas paludis]|uniref:Tetratricopeptide repeat protein n=1 Tax=Methylomonas paludis TaxID=1173101 RepID=A0A975MLW9_9GAMM|nr:tetratricopeptide repeat protein [Methylomonas paludis]QWF70303.1 tetratricopeptide repeat protein [Methylomonas paludis]